jgi:hypothetical protein
MSDGALSESETEILLGKSGFNIGNKCNISNPIITEGELTRAKSQRVHSYTYDFRLMTPEQLATIDENREPGDTISYDPPDPMDRWERYLPPEELCMHMVGGELATAEYAKMCAGEGQSDYEWENEQRAKAKAYQEHNNMINLLVGNKAFCAKRKAWLEKVNGIVIPEVAAASY